MCMIKIEIYTSLRKVFPSLKIEGVTKMYIIYTDIGPLLELYTVESEGIGKLVMLVDVETDRKGTITKIKDRR